MFGCTCKIKSNWKFWTLTVKFAPQPVKWITYLIYLQIRFSRLTPREREKEDLSSLMPSPSWARRGYCQWCPEPPVNTRPLHRAQGRNRDLQFGGGGEGKLTISSLNFVTSINILITYLWTKIYIMLQWTNTYFINSDSSKCCSMVFRK